jgi:hypothetical protein
LDGTTPTSKDGTGGAITNTIEEKPSISGPEKRYLRPSGEYGRKKRRGKRGQAHTSLPNPIIKEA